MILRHIRIPPVGLPGTLWLPNAPKGLVAFIQGSGSGRFDARSSALAAALSQRGFATLLLDLLTFQEERLRWNIFDIDLLARRLAGMISWLEAQPDLAELPLGLFAAGTAAAAALVAAERGPIQAIVTYAGRPDLAQDVLEDVRTPVLLLVPEAQGPLVTRNQSAYERLKDPKSVRLIPWANRPSHEADAVAGIVDLAAHWFTLHLRAALIREEKGHEPLGQSSSPGPHSQQVPERPQFRRSHDGLRQIGRHGNDR